MGKPVVGGFRTIPGSIQPFGAIEHQLLDMRAKMKESNEIYHHKTQLAVARNYGDLDLEMVSERTITTAGAAVDQIRARFSDTPYQLDAGTPLFIARSRGDVHSFAGRIGDQPVAGQNTALGNGVALTLDQPASAYGLIAGKKININGEDRTITAVAGNTITLDLDLSVAPQQGAQITTVGRNVANPHLEPVYHVTDKYGTGYLDENRYHIDYSSGLIKYRPDNGTLANSIWHPEAAVDKPYYFGRKLDIQTLPPPDILGQDNNLGTDVIAGGSTTTVVNLTQTVAALNINVGEKVTINGETRIITAAGGSSITLIAPLTAAPLAGAQAKFIDRSDPVLPNNFTNLVITAPAGVVLEVQLNGGIVASTSDASRGLFVPFYDNAPDNDNLKEDESIDPDNYLYKYLKVGGNHLVIKATEPNGLGARGVRVEGRDGLGNATPAPLFYGVDISTNNSDISADPLDWSTSQHSVLGIAGKIDFQIADRNRLEDLVDLTEQNNGVLESLTSMLSDLDINHLKSLLATVR